MDTERLKEAVAVIGIEIMDENCTVFRKKHLNVLLDIATAYLYASGGMPKKKDETCSCPKHCHCQAPVNIGYNQAIADCTLALMKRCEGIEELVLHYITQEPIEKEIIGSSLARTIRQHILGG